MHLHVTTLLIASFQDNLGKLVPEYKMFLDFAAPRYHGSGDGDYQDFQDEHHSTVKPPPPSTYQHSVFTGHMPFHLLTISTRH